MTKVDIIKNALAETGCYLSNTTPEKLAKRKTKAQCERFAQWLRDNTTNNKK